MNQKYNQNNKNQKIAIIGAGIAGLIAAHSLKKKGYKNITIYESEDRVGGKVFSVKHGDRIFEMGAIILIRPSKFLEALAKKYKMLTTKYTKQGMIYSKGREISYLRYMKENITLNDIVKAISGIYKFISAYKKFKNKGNIGFAGSDPALFTNFRDYLNKYNLKGYTYLSAPASAAFGYGKIDSTPALYYMKMMRIGLGYVIRDHLNSSLGPKFHIIRTFDKGYQRFLEKIAKNFTLKLDARVTAVRRRQEGNSFKVHVTSNGDTEIFDRIIISTMPSDTLQFLDAERNESDIFRKVKHYLFRVTLFTGSIKLKADSLYFDPNILYQNPGFPGALNRLHRGTEVFTAYQTHQGELSTDELDEQLNNMAGMLGGSIENVIESKTYKYFPHFPENHLKVFMPYEKLEEMQGKNGTYYIGGLFNFEGTEQTAEWSDYIINKYF